MEDTEETSEDTITLLEILSNNSCLPETQIWALCRECCLLLDYILDSPDMFQSVVITPETIGLDSSGNICFLHAENEPESLFLPSDYEYLKTAKSHVYSLGMTMLYAAKYNATNGDTNAISSNLSRLVGRMTADRPSERPTFQMVLAECDKILQDPSQDICQQIVLSAQTTDIDNNSTSTQSTHKSGSQPSVTPLGDLLSQYTDTARLIMASKLSDHSDNIGNRCKSADDNNNEGITVSEVLENRVDYLQEAELWALCREGIISIMSRQDRLPAYISLDTLLLSEQGSILYKAIPEDKPMEVHFMAPELQERGVLSEKGCLYGLGVTLHSAAGHKSTDMLDISQELQSLLLDMSDSDQRIRPSLDEALAICDKHEEDSEVPSYAICQFMFQDTAAMMIENEEEEESFLNKVSSLTSNKLTQNVTGDETQESNKTASTPMENFDTDCSSNSRNSNFNSSMSAFTPLSAVSIAENKPLSSSAYLPRAYTSISTHFTPIVLQKAENTTGDSNELDYDSNVVKKLKHLQQKLMKSPKALGENTRNVNESSRLAFNHSVDDTSSIKSPANDLPASQVPSPGSGLFYEGSHQSNVKKANEDREPSTKEVFTNIFSDEDKISQLHVLAETVAQYLNAANKIPVQNAASVSQISASNPTYAHSSKTPANIAPTAHGLPSTDSVYIPVNFGNGSVANYPVKLQFQQDPLTGAVQLVPVGLMPPAVEPEQNWDVYDNVASLKSHSSKNSQNSASKNARVTASKKPDSNHDRFSDGSPRVELASEPIYTQILYDREGEASDVKPHPNHYVTCKHGLKVMADDFRDDRSDEAPVGATSDAFDVSRALAGCGDEGALTTHVSVSNVNSHSSSPSPSKDSGVSGVHNSAYPTLLDRLLGNDAIKQQEMLQEIVQVIRRDFGDNAYFENGTEEYNIGEYVMSLGGLKWETFTCAITEKYTQLHWPGPCLEHLYQLTQKSAANSDKCPADNADRSNTASTRHKKVCRVMHDPQSACISPSQASDGSHCCSDRINRNETACSHQSNTAVGSSCLKFMTARHADVAESQVIVSNISDTDEMYANCTVMAPKPHPVPASERIGTSPCLETSACDDFGLRDTSFSFSLPSEDLTLDSVAIKDSSFVEHLDNDNVFSVNNSLLDQTSATVTTSASQFTNLSLMLPHDLTEPAENSLNFSDVETASAENPQLKNSAQNSEAVRDYLHRFGMLESDGGCHSNSGISTPRCHSYKNPEDVIDASNASPISCDVKNGERHCVKLLAKSPESLDKNYPDEGESNIQIATSGDQKEGLGHAPNDPRLSPPVTTKISVNETTEQGKNRENLIPPEKGKKTVKLTKPKQYKSDSEILQHRIESDPVVVCVVIPENYPNSSRLPEISKSECDNSVDELRKRYKLGESILKAPRSSTLVEKTSSDNLGGAVSGVDVKPMRLASSSSKGSDTSVVNSPLSMIQSKRGNVVYHMAELKYCGLPELKQFIQELDPLNSISLDRRKSQIDQQIFMERKMKRKTQTFYKKLISNKAAKNEQKALITQVARDIKEMTQKLEFLELAKGHLEMLLSEQFGLNLSLLYSLAMADYRDLHHDLHRDPPLTPAPLQPNPDNPLLQFHISHDPSSATDTRVLHAGQPDGLMSYLYAASSLSDSYVHQFFYCFRYFLYQERLLSFIQDRYIHATRHSSTPQNMKVTRRSVDLLYFWLEGYYSVDFEHDQPLTDKLETFIRNDISGNDVNTRSLLLLFNNCQDGVNMELSFSGVLSTDDTDVRIIDVDTSLAKKWESFKAIINRKSTAPRERPCRPRIASSRDRRRNVHKTGIYFPQSTTRSDQFCLMDYSMHQVAEQLTLMEQELFQACHPVHFLDSKSQGFGVAMTLPGAPKTPSALRRSFIDESSCQLSSSLFIKPVTGSDAIDKMVEHSQLVAHWVAAEILSCSTPKVQLLVLTRFLHVAHLCLQIRNFATSMAIVDALESLTIRQLPTWKQLASKSVNLMGQLSSIKVLLKNDASCLIKCPDFRSRPTIPSTLVFLLHVQRLEIGSFKLVNGMYKWAKMRDICTLLDLVRMFKDRVHSYDPDYCLQDHLRLRVAFFADKDLHSIAVQNDTNYQKLGGGGVLQGALRKMRVKLGAKNDRL